MDQKTLLTLTHKYSAYISIHASILRCVKANFKSLEDLRSSANLLKILDAVINATVAKVRVYPMTPSSTDIWSLSTHYYVQFVYAIAIVYLLDADQCEVSAQPFYQVHGYIAMCAVLLFHLGRRQRMHVSICIYTDLYILGCGYVISAVSVCLCYLWALLYMPCLSLRLCILFCIVSLYCIPRPLCPPAYDSLTSCLQGERVQPSVRADADVGPTRSVRNGWTD